MNSTFSEISIESGNVGESKLVGGFIIEFCGEFYEKNMFC
jgi:hypothetical protein